MTQEGKGRKMVERRKEGRRKERRGREGRKKSKGGKKERKEEGRIGGGERERKIGRQRETEE